MNYKSKRAKACDIPKAVKEKVFERDGGFCIFCGSPYASPVCHFIARSQNGLGVERNILTLCAACHFRYDNTSDRQEMREFFRKYLKSKYADWNEDELIYKKFNYNATLSSEGGRNDN